MTTQHFTQEQRDEVHRLWREVDTFEYKLRKAFEEIPEYDEEAYDRYQRLRDIISDASGKLADAMDLVDKDAMEKPR